MMQTTLIVWMGEFGRTPKFPRPDGRDHWPNSFSAVLAGGGIKGGQEVKPHRELGLSADSEVRPVKAFHS